MAIDNQRFDARARQFIDRRGEHSVEALTRGAVRDADGDRFVFAGHR
jgi:hypothetical protein